MPSKNKLGLTQIITIKVSDYDQSGPIGTPSIYSTCSDPSSPSPTLSSFGSSVYSTLPIPSTDEDYECPTADVPDIIEEVDEERDAVEEYNKAARKHIHMKAALCYQMNRQSRKEERRKRLFQFQATAALSGKDVLKEGTEKEDPEGYESDDTVRG